MTSEVEYEIREVEAPLQSIEKEPAKESLRFLVFVMTSLFIAILNVGAEFLPVLNEIPRSMVETFSWQLAVLALGFIAARTVRNTQ